MPQGREAREIGLPFSFCRVWQVRERLRLLDDRLVAAVDASAAEAARRASDHLTCRLGCTECCHGPFPIDALDARRLAQGLAELDRRDRARASSVRARAEAARRFLEAGFPGDPEAGHLDAEGPELDEFLARHGHLPCPALDPATGGCDLYSTRPLSCRTYGPPVLLADERLEPCRLCFVAADEATIEACRVEPDLSAEEDAFTALVGEGIDSDVETLIAFALANPERWYSPPRRSPCGSSPSVSFTRRGA